MPYQLAEFSGGRAPLVGLTRTTDRLGGFHRWNLGEQLVARARVEGPAPAASRQARLSGSLGKSPDKMSIGLRAGSSVSLKAREAGLVPMSRAQDWPARGPP